MLKNNPRKHWITAATIVTILIIAAVAALTTVTLAPRILAPRAAAVYHVDASAPPGGDGSFDTPWNTIGDHVPTLRQGDTMYIHAGTYDEPATIRLSQSGRPETPITLRAYQDEQVVIHTPGSTNIIRITGDYWHIHGLTLDKKGRSGTAIALNASHNVIRKNEICHGAYNGIRLDDADDNLIADNHIHHIIGAPGKDGAGILLADGSNDNLIQNNDIHDCSDAILFYVPVSAEPGNYDITGNVIADNHLWVSPELAPCCENGIDIKAGNPTIVNNVLHGFRYSSGDCGSSGNAGEAILVHGQLVDTVILTHNEIYDSATGIRVHYNTDATVVIQYNLIHHLTRDPLAWCHAAIMLNQGDYRVHHNTIAHSPAHYPLVHYAGNLHLQNNLIYDTLQARLQAGANAVADYNGWFDVPAWTGFEGPHDTTGDDPLLTAHYRLTNSSPARGRGENGIDLGAFPYAPAQPTATPTTTSPIVTPTPPANWWDDCPACTPYPIQPTYTPRPAPTCQPCSPPTPYPTSTPYPPQPGGE